MGKNKENKKKGSHIVKREAEQDRINNIVYGGVAAMVAIAGLVLPYMLFFSSAGIIFLNTSDMDQLKTVFYGGDPWVVVCQQNSEVMTDTVTKAINELYRNGVQVGVVQCSSKLPSNKTISEKFKLTRTKPATAFLCVNGMKPTQVPKPSMQNANRLVRWVKPRVVMKVAEVERTSTLYQNCYNRKLCAIVVKYGDLSNSETKLVDKLAKENRGFGFNVVNTQKSRFSLSKKLPDDDKEPLVVFVKKEILEDTKKETAAVKLYKGDFDLGALSRAFSDEYNEMSDTEYKVLKKRPTVKPRKKRHEKTQSRTTVRPTATKQTKPRKQRPTEKAGSVGEDESSPTSTEGMVSEAERQRRKQLDEEMESMIQAADGDDIEEEEDDEEDDYEEVLAEEEEM